MLGTDAVSLKANAKARTSVTQGKAEAKAYWELEATMNSPGRGLALQAGIANVTLSWKKYSI